MSLILSVIGPHAGEDVSDIFSRKKQEIEKEGHCIWVYKSHLAKPEVVQSIGKNEEAYCYFLLPKGGSKSVRPTTVADRANIMSSDNVHWQKIPNTINPTGNIKSKPYGFIFESIELTDFRIDLKDYCLFEKESPVRFMLGASTACVKQAVHSEAPYDLRSVIAVAKLKSPYCVWLHQEVKEIKYSDYVIQLYSAYIEANGENSIDMLNFELKLQTIHKDKTSEMCKSIKKIQNDRFSGFKII